MRHSIFTERFCVELERFGGSLDDRLGERESVVPLSLSEKCDGGRPKKSTLLSLDVILASREAAPFAVRAMFSTSTT